MKLPYHICKSSQSFRQNIRKISECNAVHEALQRIAITSGAPEIVSMAREAMEKCDVLMNFALMDFIEQDIELGQGDQNTDTVSSIK